MPIKTTEIHLKLLRQLEENPALTQRELSRELGVSLGKTNYCLKALIEKGWIKATNFKNSNNKSAYAYMLTPVGLTKKAKITQQFLQRKIEEYEHLKHEIEQMQTDLSNK